MGSDNNELRNRSRNCKRDSSGIRKYKKKGKFIYCTDCGFRSKRAFNVIRHYQRIHEPSKKKLRCCGGTYSTKGHLYQHCLTFHPETRKSSIVLKTKYKMMTKMMKEQRRSTRHAKTTKTRGIQDFHTFDENTPLIFYLENIKSVKIKEEEIKLENNHEFDIDSDCVEIIFKGDAKSPFHAKIQQEFLKFIDFENYKLI